MQLVVFIQLWLLEDSVGVLLLECEGCGVKFLVVGEVMVDYVVCIFDFWCEVGDEMVVQCGVFFGILWLGVVIMVEYLLLLLLVVFFKVQFSVKVQFKVGNCDEIVQMLVGQQVDLVVMGWLLGELKIIVVLFVCYFMVFMVVFVYLLMKKCKVIMLLDLVEVNLLVCEFGLGMCVMLECLYKDVGLLLCIGLELFSNEVIKQMCVVGFGVVFLLLYICGFELEIGMLVLLLMKDNLLECDWYVMYLVSCWLLQVVLVFKGFLVEEVQVLIFVQLCGLKVRLV